MNGATTEPIRRRASSAERVGELLYRFEAELRVTPIGLTPEGIRMTVDYEGEITAGMMRGARVWGTDPLLLRTDGVGVVDTVKTISDGSTALYEHVRAYCVPPGPRGPAARGHPGSIVQLARRGVSDPRLLDIPAGDPDYGYLNTTIAAIEGSANFASGRNAIETRVLRHAGTAAPPRRG